MTGHIRPLLLGVLLSALPVQPASSGPNAEEEATPEWHKGPPRYILSLKENEAYRRLKTVEARRTFVDEFWRSLDPTPGTPENERREEFWRRVEQSDLLFRDSLRPGWTTDRGRIYILLGPPDGERRSQDLLAWAYRESPPPEALPALKFVFFKLAGGEFSLAPDRAREDPRGSTEFSAADQAGRIMKTNTGGGGRLQDILCPGGGDAQSHTRPPYRDGMTVIPPPYRGDRGKAVGPGGHQPSDQAFQLIPGRIRLPAGGSAADYFFAPIYATWRFHYSRAADGATLATLTLAIPPDRYLRAGTGSGAPDLTLAVSIRKAPGLETVSRVRKKLVPDARRDATSGEPLRFQAGFALPPGDYRVEGSVIDERDHRGSVFSEDLTLPDFRIGLQLSDITIAGTPEEDRSGRPSPGRQVALPDPAATFAPGATILLSCQVYNAVLQGEDADLEVQVDFFSLGGKEARPAGKPIVLRHVKMGSLATTLSLAGWVEGRYRVRVAVTDNLNGATTSREEEFRVAGPLP